MEFTPFISDALIPKTTYFFNPPTKVAEPISSFIANLFFASSRASFTVVPVPQTIKSIEGGLLSILYEITSSLFTKLLFPTN